VSVRWLGEHRTQVDVRGVHRLQGDEPPEYGGGDAGPMPTELLLSAVGTCMCLAVAHVARKRRLPLGQLSLEVGAEKDVQEFRLREIFVTVHADLPQEQLDQLVRQASRYCFVSNTLTAGCQVHYTAAAIAGSEDERLEIRD